MVEDRPIPFCIIKAPFGLEELCIMDRCPFWQGYLAGDDSHWWSDVGGRLRVKPNYKECLVGYMIDEQGRNLADRVVANSIRKQRAHALEQLMGESKHFWDLLWRGVLAIAVVATIGLAVFGSIVLVSFMLGWAP